MATVLRYVEEPYGEESLEEFVRSFQQDGVAVLPDVYERESVAPFRAALLASLPPPSEGATPGGSFRERPLGEHPRFLSDPEPFVAALAPRLRQVLRRVPALSNMSRHFDTNLTFI